MFVFSLKYRQLHINFLIFYGCKYSFMFLSITKMILPFLFEHLIEIGWCLSEERWSVWSESSATTIIFRIFIALGVHLYVYANIGVKLPSKHKFRTTLIPMHFTYLRKAVIKTFCSFLLSNFERFTIEETHD